MKFESRPSQEELMGEGAYKNAYRSKEKPYQEVRLVLKHEYTPEQIKGLFYLNRIATLLFPGKIARISQVTKENGEENDPGAQIYAEYVDTSDDPEHVDLQDAAIKSEGGLSDNEEANGGYSALLQKRSEWYENDKEIQSFLDSYEKAGLIAGFGRISRWGPQDVIRNKDGTFTFVDADVAWDTPSDMGKGSYSKELLRFDPERLQEAIDKLDDPFRAEAQSAYNRLLALCAQAGIRL